MRGECTNISCLPDKQFLVQHCRLRWPDITASPHHSLKSRALQPFQATTPHPHHPDHSRRILDDHHQPCALVVPKPARPSKQGAVRLEFEPVLWHSAQLLSTACGSCAEPRRCTTAAATVAATTGFQTATQGARLFRRIPFCQKRLVSNVLPE